MKNYANTCIKLQYLPIVVIIICNRKINNGINGIKTNIIDF